MCTVDTLFHVELECEDVTHKTMYDRQIEFLSIHFSLKQSQTLLSSNLAATLYAAASVVLQHYYTLM